MRDLFDAVPDAMRGAPRAGLRRRSRRSSRAPSRPGDAILVKGSLGSRMKLVVDCARARVAEAA